MGGLTNRAAKRVFQGIKKVEKLGRSQLASRRQIVPTSSESPCTEKLLILVQGAPSGGNLVIPVTVNGTMEDVTIPIPATTSQVKSAFESHSEIDVDQVAVESASGGTVGIPVYEITLTAKNGLSIDDLTLGAIDNFGASEMTGGFGPWANVRKCCG